MLNRVRSRVNNRAFILTSRQYFELPEEERTFFRPAAGTPMIQDCMIRTSEYVFYPYDETGLLIRSVPELRERLNFYYETYLKPNQSDLEGRARKSPETGGH